jgi:hypothetical protein
MQIAKQDRAKAVAVKTGATQIEAFYLPRVKRRALSKE